MDRSRKLKRLEKTRDAVLATAAQRGIDLQRVECVLPFVAGDFGLDVWFFFATRDSLALHDRNGATRELAENFLALLQGGDGAADLATGVNFRFVAAEETEGFTHPPHPIA